MTKIQINRGEKRKSFENAYFGTNRSIFATTSYPFVFKRSGFGFVTYKTVEAAKKALDDPQKMLAVSIT